MSGVTDTSTNLNLPYVMPNQAQKHVTVNEGVRRLDALVQLGVESRSVSAEPSAPADGQVWIAPAGKTGAAWGEFTDEALAYYRDGAWEQLRPRAGWRAFVRDEGANVTYDGTTWRRDDEIDAAATDRAGLRNALINGGFHVAQRGDGPFTSAYAYGPDGWRPTFGGGGASAVTVTREALGLGDASFEPLGVTHHLRAAFTGGAGTGWASVSAFVEDVRQFAGRTVTLSFWARGNGSFSVSPAAWHNFGVGGSPLHQMLFSACNVTTAWTRFERTVTLSGLAGKTIGAGHHLYIDFYVPTTGAPQLDLAAVQLEGGGAATPYEGLAHRGGLGDELRRCQRYYQPAPHGAYGRAFSASGIVLAAPFPVPMRAAPSVALAGGSASVRVARGFTATASTPALADTSATETGFHTGLTGFSGLLDTDNVSLIASGGLHFSAEY